MNDAGVDAVLRPLDADAEEITDPFLVPPSWRMPREFIEADPPEEYLDRALVDAKSTLLIDPESVSSDEVKEGEFARTVPHLAELVHVWAPRLGHLGALRAEFFFWAQVEHERGRSAKVTAELSRVRKEVRQELDLLKLMEPPFVPSDWEEAFKRALIYQSTPNPRLRPFVASVWVGRAWEL